MGRAYRPYLMRQADTPQTVAHPSAAGPREHPRRGSTKGHSQMVSADDYLSRTDSDLIQADRDPERARVEIAEAQVFAIQAVASAISRLAEAVENLQR